MGGDEEVHFATSSYKSYCQTALAGLKLLSLTGQALPFFVTSISSKLCQAKTDCCYTV